MVHSHHRRQDSSESNHHHLLPLVNSNPILLRLFFLFSFFSFTILFVPRIILPPYYFPSETEQDTTQLVNPCSSVANNTICCDRTNKRTDVCYMRGDIRTNSQSNSLLLFTNKINVNTSKLAEEEEEEEEKIRPYTRKWEANTMSTIDELTLRASNKTGACDVTHDVPAVFFSTGGYTGNVYHEFNDGIIPLYITSQKFERKVVFVILEYHDWWITKYENILTHLSDYPPIDFSNDKRTHCFKEAIVGLNIHDELTIDAKRMTNNKTIGDFREILDRAYKPRIQSIIEEEEEEGGGAVIISTITPARQEQPKKATKLVIISRNGSRGIENEGELARLATKIGFNVQILRPDRTTELAKVYRALNSSDLMIGVHGAAMTHFMFMRPGSVFIQIVPLGTDWAAESYYGEPAVKLGLKYMKYKITPKESSLYREYEKDDPVLTDPDSVNARGWEVTKRVYLDGQNVRLDLERFQKRLVVAYRYLSATKRNRKIDIER